MRCIPLAVIFSSHVIALYMGLQVGGVRGDELAVVAHELHDKVVDDVDVLLQLLGALELKKSVLSGSVPRIISMTTTRFGSDLNNKQLSQRQLTDKGIHEGRSNTHRICSHSFAPLGVDERYPYTTSNRFIASYANSKSPQV